MSLLQVAMPFVPSSFLLLVETPLLPSPSIEVCDVLGQDVSSIMVCVKKSAWWWCGWYVVRVRSVEGRVDKCWSWMVQRSPVLLLASHLSMVYIT